MDIFDLWKPLALVCVALLLVFPEKGSIVKGMFLGAMFVMAAIGICAIRGVPILVFLTLEEPLPSRGILLLTIGYVIIIGNFLRAIYQMLWPKSRHNQK